MAQVDKIFLAAGDNFKFRKERLSMEPLRRHCAFMQCPVVIEHMKTQHPPEPSVAIVGIGCIFAKSHDLKAFYHLLSRGISGITDPPDSHRHLRDYFDADPKKPDHIYCNRGGYLPPIKFDPTEFSIPPNVLEATDTSQLLGLVTAKKALEDAGYGDNGRTFDRNKASVILGVTGTQELVIPLGARLGHPLWRKALTESGVSQDQADEVMERIADGYVSWQENSFPGLLGNVVAGRIANRLDLGGTNCVVDAACASSMGAIHMAMLELQSGRSDMVITGGVDTINDAFMHMCFSKTQILSASGDIRPFSKDADGTVLGEGVGLVVLKRRVDAEKDGDRIYAVIKGLASSSDGRSQSIYAPRSDGQAKALHRAYAEAGIDPTTVSLVEAHGTGTRVGDQVEFNSLCDVFGATSPNGNRCALGSVKSNIGHTKAAAGTAGLIKAALSIYHKVLPPTLKADPVDPKLGVDHSPFYLNTQLRPWIEQQGERRRAGVSAFGFGGSNFHAVLEEYSEHKLEPAWDGAVEIAAFSGSNEAEVAAQIDKWRERVVEDPTTHQIGKASQQCRKQFRTSHAVRLVMVIDPYAGADHLASICADAVKRLGGDEGNPAHRIFIGKGAPSGGVAFMFPGQGSQYVGMGRDLTCCFPESMAVLEEASRCLDAEETLDEYLFPRMPGSAEALESRLRQTRIAQPAIGAVSVAMMASLARFGVRPDATCGHSYGELVALHAAGWMGREDLWRLSIERGRLMAEAGDAAGETGAMLAVQAPLKEIDQWIDESDCQVVLANRNSREQGILSGTAAAIEAAEKACRGKGWRSVRLPVAAAFHSPLVGDARKPFRDCAASVQFTPGSIPVMSNTLGGAYPATSEEIPSILGRQLASSVDFVANIEALYGLGIRTFVEIGPKTVLSRLVGAILTNGDANTVALDASLGRSSGIQDLAAAISRLAALGHSVDLTQWEKPQARKSKARMAIDLTGANVRNPRPHGKQIPKRTPVISSTTGPDRLKMPQNQARVTESPKPAVPPAAAARPTSTSEQRNPTASAPIHRSNPNIQQALTAVQQGLESLQALQAQTVQAHQKFLDTQAAASQTLQQMIQGARQLATGSFGGLAAGMDATLDSHKPDSGNLDSGQKAAPPVPERVSPAPPVRPEPALAENKPDPVQKINSLAKGDRAPNTSESTAGLEKVLLDIVSRLTGYPEEMLGMEMDIESDLGIDSIKRVEILSALEEQMPDLPKVTPDLMGTLKTLGQIVDYLKGPAPGKPSLPATPTQPGIRIVPDTGAQSVARHIIATETLADSGASEVSISNDHYIGVAGGENGLKDDLIHRLRERGRNVRSLENRDDFNAHPNLAGLVLLAPIDALDAFQWAQSAAPLLQQSASVSDAFLATVSFLDGAFGFNHGRIDHPIQGGLAGLVKTAAIEWPSVRCMALDVAPYWTDTAASTQAICDELLHVDEAGRREIGIGPAGRIGLKLTPQEAAGGETLRLSPKDVVIVTGGARGVTAAAAQALAAASPCTLVLMGRSPAPQPEPAWLQPLSDEGAIKKAILSNWDAEASPTPKSVEKVFRRWSANREMLNTLDRLGQTGADAHYVSVDVRDADAIQAETAKIRTHIGPIRGIIHGAGVLEDRLIVDKQAEQFDKVFATKVEGLHALLRATADDALRHLVLFSSVTARMGNTGQADYAMANEVLNKTALQQASLRPDCKVIAINWGPWDGGMVTPSLRRNFRDQGISLIPLQAGARAMVDEMGQPIGEAVEVVIGGPLPQASPQHRMDIAKPSPAKAEALNLTCQRDVSVEQYPVLDAHQLDGRPVVPLALITEWLAHSALHAHPGLVLHGMDRLRLLSGITLDGQTRKIRMLAGKAHRKDDRFEVDVEIRDGETENGHRIHSSAKAILSERLPAPPAFSENGHFQPDRPVGPIEEIYEQVLFHGRALHGIQQIVRISDEGITARLATAPPPSDWIHDPLRSRWIADPLVLDSAFQMAIVWCHQQRGLFPQTGVSAVLEVHHCSTRKLAGDFTFLDAEKTVLAQLKGYEAVMDPSLMKAFKAA
ncbi:MAG: SDR family NAD(P)-dependent oxidoreductase [Desulfobacteraceae bacterium]